MDDAYCAHCDVFGHYENSTECQVYYASVELPFQERMKKMEGKIMKLGDPAPSLYKDLGPPAGCDIGYSTETLHTLPGTFVRLLHWQPFQEGFKAGDYWVIETLDGEWNAGQIYNDELEELSALDKLSLIKDQDDGPRC